MLKKIQARIASQLALKLRAAQGILPNAPANAYEIATALKIDVRFIDVPSLEGMFMPDGAATILVSSLRPAGRQHFTCAHELGHQQLKHGQKIDELVEARGMNNLTNPEEMQADSFAAFLLMPKSAVFWAFTSRGWDPALANAEQFYIVANWLGVGYASLVNHAAYQLKMITLERATELTHVTLRKLRSEILGRPCPGGLHYIDQFWNGREIDCSVGDILIFPAEAKYEGVVLAAISKTDGRTVVQANEKGSVAIKVPGFSATVRVSKKGYTGRYIYKFEPEVPE